MIDAPASNETAFDADAIFSDRPDIDRVMSNEGDADVNAIILPSDILEPETAPRRRAISQDQATLAFARAHAAFLRYDHGRGRWFLWTGVNWQEDQKGSVFELARQFARHLAVLVDERGREALGRLSFAEKIEKGARSDNMLAVTSSEWDSHELLLGTPGGTVDLKSGILRPSNPTELITKLTAVAPSSSADCPRFLRFLDEATGGDAELVRFLQQFCGYSLTGSIREHALAFVYGPGGNGKSVFANTIARILKDYATVAPMEALTASTSSRHETELAMLKGARLVTASETEAGKHWAEARIKQLTGGDPISARFMRQDFFTFNPNFKLLIIGNHKPALRTVDDAIRRRLNIVEFTRVPAVPDLTLESKLWEEHAAILRWMLDGCLDWQRAGLVRPKCVVDASREYLASHDTFSRWLDEACEPDPEARDTAGALRQSWDAYATMSGEESSNANRFSEAMRTRGFENKRGAKGTRYYLGLRLRREVSSEVSVAGDG